MTSNYDPIESTAKGAVQGFLKWTDEKVKEAIVAFKNKELAFIEDPEVIERVKKQRKKAEWAQFKFYTNDSDLHILYQMGLTLREYEKEGKDFRLITRKITKKYKKKGLHFAQFVQNGLCTKYISLILEQGATPEKVKIEVGNLCDNIDKTVMFVRHRDEKRLGQKIGEIVSKINSHSPDTFIISSVGGAIKTCEKIKKGVLTKLPAEYTCELYESDFKEQERRKKIFFLNRMEDI